VSPARSLLVAASLIAPLGCDGAPAPKAPVTDEIVVADEAPAPKATFTQQVGGMNQEAVEKSFARLQKSVIRCLERGSSRLEGLGGTFTLNLRIAMDGSVRWVHLSSSNLGDRQSERCILDAAASRSWPQPKGGEGEINHTYTVDAAVPVHVWQAKRLRTAMPEIRKKVWKCFGGARGHFETTLYIKQSGRVASAGVAPPRHEDDEKVDCLVDVLTGLSFGWQRQKLTKVTFTLP